MSTPHRRNPFYVSSPSPKTSEAPAAPVHKTLHSETGDFGFMNSNARHIYAARQAAETMNSQRAEIRRSLKAAQRETLANPARIERLTRDLEIIRLSVIAAKINAQLEFVKRRNPTNVIKIERLTRQLDAARGKMMAAEAAGFAKKGCVGCSIQGGRRQSRKLRRSRLSRLLRLSRRVR